MKNVWFCVILLSLAGEEEIVIETTNRLEADETADILNEINRMTGTWFKVYRKA